jgi:hypothetical protein
MGRAGTARSCTEKPVLGEAALKGALAGFKTRAPIILVLRISAIFGLGIMIAACDGGLIEAGSNIGATDIDKIIRKEGHNPGSVPSTESSPMSTAMRAYLVDRAKQGGITAADAALSEAGASCRASIDQTRHCELKRYHVLRSADLVGARYARTDWIISISYDRRGNDIQNVHVTYTWTGELIK